MNPLAALLAVALAAGPSDAPRRSGADVSNAARAKAGLLPRKAARASGEVRGARRLVRAPAPTWLAAPAEPEDAASGARDEAVAEPAAPGLEAARLADRLPSAPPEDEPRLAARGPVVTSVVQEVVAAAAPAAPDLPPGEPAMPPVLSAPEELGALRAAARGVVAEVTLTMRFDP